MGLAAIRIAKRNMHPGKFLILQQDPDHPRQPKICSKRQFAHSVTVLIRMAIRPKILSPDLFARIPLASIVRRQSQYQRRRLQIPVFSIKIIARRRIANKSAIHGRRRREYFSRR